MASDSMHTNTTPPQNKVLQTLLPILGVPIAQFLNMTGLYARLFQMMKGKIAAERVKNNFGTYQPNKHDVVVCTFPKSGTNWMLQIAYQISHRGQGEFDSVHQYMPWPDVFFDIEAKLEDETIAQRSPFGLRVIKTHLSGEYVPYTPDAKYICILRDPKDVLVSSYFFIRDVIFGAMMPSVKTWHKTFISDSFMLGS
jgi:Sulfotransferase domain